MLMGMSFVSMSSQLKRERKICTWKKLNHNNRVVLGGREGKGGLLGLEGDVLDCDHCKLTDGRLTLSLSIVFTRIGKVHLELGGARWKITKKHRLTNNLINKTRTRLDKSVLVTAYENIN